MDTPPTLLPKKAEENIVTTRQPSELLSTLSEEKVHMMSQSFEVLPSLSELDIRKTSRGGEEQKEENNFFEDNKNDFVLVEPKKSLPSSIKSQESGDQNSSLTQVPLFSLDTNDLHEKNSPAQPTTALEFEISSTTLVQMTKSEINKEEFMVAKTSCPLPSLHVETQISSLKKPAISQDYNLITQPLSCSEDNMNACTSTKSRTPGAQLQLHKLEKKSFSPKHHPIRQDDMLKTHSSLPKKISDSQDDKSIIEPSLFLEENKKACMTTKSSGSPLMESSFIINDNTPSTEPFLATGSFAPLLLLHDLETTSKQPPIDYIHKLIREPLPNSEDHNKTTESSGSPHVGPSFLKYDNETPKLVDLPISSTKVMTLISSPTEPLVQKETSTMVLSSIEQKNHNTMVAEPSVSLHGEKNVDVAKFDYSMGAELPPVQSTLSQDNMDIDIVLEPHDLPLSSIMLDVSDTSLVPSRQNEKEMSKVDGALTPLMHVSYSDRNDTNDEKDKVQELAPSFFISDFSKSSTRQPSLNDKKRKAETSFRAQSSLNMKIHTSTKHQRLKPPTRSSIKQELADPSSESSLIEYFKSLLMGCSRGNFNADEDSSQRSRRKKNATSGEHSESSAAGQVTTVRKKATYHCNYCNKDITGRNRIKCAECSDFDLCIECFSVGAEVHPHKSDHPYKNIDNISFPLICPDWNADEESLLLEGIDMYGIANWAEIAEHVGTKDTDSCVEHYRTFYLESPCFPLPDMTYATGKNRTELLAMAKEHADGATSTSKASNVAQVKNSPSSTKFKDNMSERSTGDKKPKSSRDNSPSLMELSGYNPKRHEFDVEYDNDAEQLLVDMEFKETDTPEEHKVKLRILRIFNNRLDERQRRKDFIIERNLLQPRPFEEGLSAEEKDLCSRYDCFMRFHSREEHEKLLETVITEHRLLKQINELKEARAAGCRSSDEARRYFELKRKREAKESARSGRGNAQPGSSSQGGLNAPTPTESAGGKANLGATSSAFDVMAYPESNLLTNYEKRVCSELKLTPPDYLRMQEVMSIMIFRGQILKKTDAYPVFSNIEQIKVDWVYDMLVKKGIATP